MAATGVVQRLGDQHPQVCLVLGLMEALVCTGFGGVSSSAQISHWLGSSCA